MTDIVAALDVGATNTRARIAAVGGEGAVPLGEDVVVQLGSAYELYGFAGAVASDAGRHGNLKAVVVAVAGPVLGFQSRITNWSGDATIEGSGLEAAGLPPGRTSLVNDVVAGAWGAMERVGAGAQITLRPGSVEADEARIMASAGNVVYVAPGTGLGAAALVRHGLGPLGSTAVGCESQHTDAPSPSGEAREVIGILSDALGRAPTWEDIVSGRGLVRLYSGLRAVQDSAPLTLRPDDADRAAEVAEAALSGSDAWAVSAMEIYYETLGRFAQLLALAFLPCAAVVVGGASTGRNLEFARRGTLTEAFLDNRRLGAVLDRIAIYAVGDEVNLEGGIWLAARM